MNTEQKLNILAIELLEQRGNRNPTQREINRMEFCIRRLQNLHSLSYANCRQSVSNLV
jgi:hypothetical protein